jgi:hypothetical protein
MKFAKRTLALSIAAGITLFSTGCADDNLAKGLVTIGGGVGGALLGTQIAKSNGASGLTGAILGGGAGAGLGLLLGGMMTKK